MILKPSRTSATRLAIGPFTIISCSIIRTSSSGNPRAFGTRFAEGRMEAIPHALAGFRKEPPMSLPRPMADIPVARAAASPPLEPPTARLAFQGFRVSPCKAVSVWERRPKSGRFVRPIGIAPAARIRWTMGASTGTTLSASARTP